MFWKKKNKTKKVEALFTYEDTCRRGFVRVRPPASDPVVLDIVGENVEVLDISAGGVACRCGSVRAGEIRPFRIMLPGQDEALTGQVKVLKVTDDQVCHCRFLDLSPEHTDALHQYALLVQKKELQEQAQRRE